MRLGIIFAACSSVLKRVSFFILWILQKKKIVRVPGNFPSLVRIFENHSNIVFIHTIILLILYAIAILNGVNHKLLSYINILFLISSYKN